MGQNRTDDDYGFYDDKVTFLIPSHNVAFAWNGAIAAWSCISSKKLDFMWEEFVVSLGRREILPTLMY